ncbi:hypothetical protein J4526_08310 [Desulfurococcaceae archaeon MEX13E-LK6-19]|nr:hypothetical protein J4526_08310 [Desulfurococcaceae archaeon MEX13E-LK6-19]
MAVEVRIPLHITGFWRPVYRENPLYTGSLGAGVNITPKIVVRARMSNAKEFYLNDNRVDDIHAVNYVFTRIPCSIRVEAWTKAPLGAGYGLSGGLALGVSIAAAIVCREEITLENAAARAHIAEVMAKTGLGDVIAEYYGGLEIRTKPGAPGIGSIVKIPVDPSVRVVSIVLGKWLTSDMLARYTPELSRIAETLLEKLIERPSLEVFIEVSQLFTRRFFNYKLIDQLVAPLRKMIIGYYVKKGVGVIFVDKDRVDDVVSYFRENKFEVIHGNIDYSGVEVVDTP